MRRAALPPLRGLFAATIVSGVALSACAGDDECSSAATIAAFVGGREVHSTDCRTFRVDGRAVRFTHVEYGDLVHCRVACLPSHVCGVEDGSSVQLYSALWYNADRPAGTTCPDPPTGSPGAHCTGDGHSHPLAQTRAFMDFLAEQTFSGSFMECF